MTTIAGILWKQYHMVVRVRVQWLFAIADSMERNARERASKRSRRGT